MVFNVSSYVRPAKQSQRAPFLNELFVQNYGSQATSMDIGNQLQKKMQFWRWFKNRPELNSPVSARVNDTISEVDFYAPDGGVLGRNKRLEAERFWTDNFVDERMKAAWYDAVVTGSGFMYQGRLQTEQLRKMTDAFAGKLASRYRIDKKEVADRLFLKAVDEELGKPRVLDYVASSTVIINHDLYDVTDYTQNVMGKTTTFEPEEIIHFPFQRIDGRVHGYTPVESLMSELILIWFVKENMLSYMRNGGLPRKLFTLPDEMANSENHKFIIQQLQEFGAIESRHGNFVWTGKIDVKDIEEKLRDLEYKELHLLATSNVAYALQVPVSRIPYMIGQSQSKGDAGGLAEGGYWSLISSDQRKIENLMNTQCLKKRGFIMKFRRSYKQDDVREANVMSMKADSIQKVQAILKPYKQELTVKKIVTLMDLDDDDVADTPPDRLLEPMQQTGLMNQNLLNHNQTMMEPDKLKKNDTKRQAAVNNPKGVVRDAQ